MNIRLALLAALLLASTVQAAPPEPKFRAVTIDDKIQIGYGVAVADVDGDKLPDILLADKKQFVWYRNPGGDDINGPEKWAKHVMAENLTKNDNVCLAAQDIDGDGKCEVAVGAEWNPGDTVNSGAVFYLIAPADRTQRWEPVKLHAEPTTHRMRWIRVAGESKDEGRESKEVAASASASAPSTLVPRPSTSAWGLVVVPLHGRGNKNGEGAGVRVLLYRPPTPLNDPKGEWKTELIDDSMHMTHNFDLPAPGKPALHLAGKEGVFGVVKVRPSDQWQRFSLSGGGAVQIGAAGVGEVRGGRLPNQEVLFCTIEPMHGNALIAHTLTAEGVRHRIVLTDKLTEGHALACGNLLGGIPGVSATDQIVVGWRGTPGKEGSTIGVALWAPLDPEGKEWRETLIDDGGMACEDLQLADLNGDGRLDIVASGRATKNVKIYLNETGR